MFHVPETLAYNKAKLEISIIKDFLPLPIRESNPKAIYIPIANHLGILFSYIKNTIIP